MWHDMPKTDCERAALMHSCSHFASQAHSRRAQQQRPENLPNASPPRQRLG
jgi:hypothetical protein